MSTTLLKESATGARLGRRAGLGAAAGLAALLVAFGAGPAFAAPDNGHVDVVFAGLNSTDDQLTLGSNDEEAEVYYDATGAAAVTWSGAQSDGSGGYVIDEEAATGFLWAGFAGAGDEAPEGVNPLLNVLAPWEDYDEGNDTWGTEGDTVTLTLVSVTGAGTAGLTFSSNPNLEVGGTGTVLDPYTYTFKVQEGDEAYHVHPTWHFSDAGDYYFTFVASTSASGVANSAPLTYHFKVPSL